MKSVDAERTLSLAAPNGADPFMRTSSILGDPFGADCSLPNGRGLTPTVTKGTLRCSALRPR